MTTNTVCLFWDIENCRIPAQMSSFACVDRIREVAFQYGQLKVCRAYLAIENEKGFKANTIRSELTQKGVQIIDTPHSGQKNVADHQIMVDMVLTAVDEPSTTTIILITGDKDFSYAISCLVNRNFRVVLFCPSGSARILTEAPSEVKDWRQGVLKLVEPRISSVAMRVTTSNPQDSRRQPYSSLQSNNRNPLPRVPISTQSNHSLPPRPALPPPRNFNNNNNSSSSSFNSNTSQFTSTLNKEIIVPPTKESKQAQLDSELDSLMLPSTSTSTSISKPSDLAPISTVMVSTGSKLGLPQLSWPSWFSPIKTKSTITSPVIIEPLVLGSHTLTNPVSIGFGEDSNTGSNIASTSTATSSTSAIMKRIYSASEIIILDSTPEKLPIKKSILPSKKRKSINDGSRSSMGTIETIEVSSDSSNSSSDNDLEIEVGDGEKEKEKEKEKEREESDSENDSIEIEKLAFEARKAQKKKAINELNLNSEVEGFEVALSLDERLGNGIVVGNESMDSIASKNLVAAILGEEDEEVAMDISSGDDEVGISSTNLTIEVGKQIVPSTSLSSPPLSPFTTLINSTIVPTSNITSKISTSSSNSHKTESESSVASKTSSSSHSHSPRIGSPRISNSNVNETFTLPTSMKRRPSQHSSLSPQTRSRHLPSSISTSSTSSSSKHGNSNHSRSRNSDSSSLSALASSRRKSLPDSLSTKNNSTSSFTPDRPPPSRMNKKDSSKMSIDANENFKKRLLLEELEESNEIGKNGKGKEKKLKDLVSTIFSEEIASAEIIEERKLELLNQTGGGFYFDSISQSGSKINSRKVTIPWLNNSSSSSSSSTILPTSNVSNNTTRPTSISMTRTLSSNSNSNKSTSSSNLPWQEKRRGSTDMVLTLKQELLSEELNPIHTLSASTSTSVHPGLDPKWGEGIVVDLTQSGQKLIFGSEGKMRSSWGESESRPKEVMDDEDIVIVEPEVVVGTVEKVVEKVLQDEVKLDTLRTLVPVVAPTSTISASSSMTPAKSTQRVLETPIRKDVLSKLVGNLGTNFISPGLMSYEDVEAERDKYEEDLDEEEKESSIAVANLLVWG